MPQTSLPGMGINYEWDAGVDGWKAGMDKNLVLLNRLALPTVINQLATPPVSPTQNDAYIVIATATGAWVGMEGEIAVWDDNNSVWRFTNGPEVGWTVFDQTVAAERRWNGAAWAVVAAAGSAGSAVTSAGTSTAYTVADGLSAYVANDLYVTDFHVLNTTAPTVDHNSLGAKTLKTSDGYTLPSGVLLGPHTYMYDGTDMILVDHTPRLLYEIITTGPAVTQIDVTGLDLDAHKSYVIEMEIVPHASSTTTISLYMNSDFTPTNYFTQNTNFNNTVLAGSRTNSSIFGVFIGGVNKSANAKIMYNTGSRDIECKITHSQSSSAAIAEHSRYISKVSPLSGNLTDLRFSSNVASGILPGFKLRIYRGDV